MIDCKWNCGGKYGHDAMCPVLSNKEAAIEHSIAMGYKWMWWNGEVFETEKLASFLSRPVNPGSAIDAD